MKGISHQQAKKWIDRRLDQPLNDRQLTLLDEHLNSCDSCRLYATEINLLPAHLRSEFHVRWDEQRGPSQKVLRHVMAKARSIPMTNRFSSGVRLLAGVAALLALAILINLVVSQLHHTSISSSETKTADNSLLAENRLLAFTSDQDGNFDIYTMHTDGSGLANLTNNPARDANPFWSPDGKQIAFESDRDGFTQIYLMDADGSNIIQLTEDKAGHNLPLNIDGRTNPWSPDGSKLLYLQQKPEDETTWLLYSININSKAKILLASGRIQSSNLSWSPNGDFVGYVLNDSAIPNETFVPGINIVKADGTQNLAVKELMPAKESVNYPFYYWSQDGQSISFTAYKHINEGQDQWIAYEADVADHNLIEKARWSTPIEDWWEGTTFITGSGVRPYLTWLRSDKTYSRLNPLENCETFDPTSEFGYGIFPRRSPSGNLIIAISCPNNDLRLYWANPSGTLVKQFLNSPISLSEGSISNIVWSPDDQFVAFDIVSPKKYSRYFLDISKSLSDAATQPVQITLDEASLQYSPSWQPRPTSDNKTVEEKPTPEPQSNNRLIAFTSPEIGNSDIFIMNTDGSKVENITNNLATDRNPVWSPHGQKIAFESDRNGKFDVYVMNADGSDLTQVTTDPAFDVLASSYDSPWSPDGKQIIVQSNRSGQDALYILPVDGKSEAIKISSIPGSIAWSPTGNQVAYSYVSDKSGLHNNDEHDAIRIINANGSNERDIVQNSLIQDVHWSSDGKVLYYREGGTGLWDIQRVSSDGGTSETILSVEDSYFPGMAWFSPVSTIVYQLTDPQGRSASLYRLEAGRSSVVGQLSDQSDSCRTTALPSAVVSHDATQALSYMTCDSGQIIFKIHDLINNTSAILGKLTLVNPEINVNWSQDDQVITIRVAQSDVSLSSGVQTSLYAFSRDEIGSPPSTLKPVIEQANGLTQTVIQPVSNNKPVNLPTPEPQHVSSTGKLIAFVSNENGNSDIYTVHSDGSTVSDLTSNPAEDTNPVWSPDGRQIAFVSNRDGNENIYIMNFDGSNITRLTEDTAQDTNPVWSPDGKKIAYASGDFNKLNTNIFVMDSDGQNQRQLTHYVPNTTVWPQAWSPDSQFILFDVYRQVVQVGIDDGLVTPITPQTDVDIPINFLLSADGSKLTYLTIDCDQNERGSNEFCNVVKTIDRYGSNEETKAIIKVPKVCGVDANLTWMGSSNHWSPDQTKLLIAFTCKDENNGWLYIANADGSDFKRLTNYPVFVNLPDQEVATFVWSPDSQSITFACPRDNAGHDGLYMLNVRDVLANSDLRPTLLNVSLSSISSIAWQPIP